MSNNNVIGEKAMQYIADYPLYASTCGITYDEAIAIAKVLNPDWQQEQIRLAEFDKLPLSEQKAYVAKLKEKKS